MHSLFAERDVDLSRCLLSDGELAEMARALLKPGTPVDSLNLNGLLCSFDPRQLTDGHWSRSTGCPEKRAWVNASAAG